MNTDPQTLTDLNEIKALIYDNLLVQKQANENVQTLEARLAEVQAKKK